MEKEKWTWGVCKIAKKKQKQNRGLVIKTKKTKLKVTFWPGQRYRQSRQNNHHRVTSKHRQRETRTTYTRQHGTRAETKTEHDRPQLLAGTLGSALGNKCKGQKPCASCSCQEPAFAQWQLGSAPSDNHYWPQRTRLANVSEFALYCGKNKQIGQKKILISEQIRGKKQSFDFTFTRFVSCFFKSRHHNITVPKRGLMKSQCNNFASMTNWISLQRPTKTTAKISNELLKR